jgi:hypothetical protein
MQPTQQLIDQLYQDKLRDARAAPFEDKLLDGARLFDRSCRIMRDGIRMQFPNSSEQKVEEILRSRLHIARRLEHRQ